jgi:hypothetical protein
VNRYSLNAKSVGSGVSVLQKYITAAVSVVVNTSATFIRTVQMVSTTVVEESSSVLAYIKVDIRAVKDIVVNTVSSVEVGLQHLASSSIVTGVNSSVNFLRVTFTSVAQAVVNSVTAGFGYVMNLVMSQPVMEVAVAPPSVFGTYADDSRTIVVDSVDSLIDLDAQSRVIYIDGLNAAIEVPPQDRSVGV